MFDKPSQNEPLNPLARERYAGTREVITVWEINSELGRYQNTRYKNLDEFDGEQVQALQNLLVEK